MKIIYFAWLREYVGCGEEHITLPAGVSTVALLIDWLSTRGPRFEKAFEFIETSKVVINQTCVQNDDLVNDDDEVMFIPPIAGG
jgi:molybdopterin synthase sulfur carrier subunit